jgi:hypothetical protein
MNTSKIKLKSRYNDVYHLTPINDGVYKFEGDAGYMRVGYNGKIDSSEIKFIDPSGGPMLQVGDSIGDKKIEKIEIVDTDYVITLK